MNGWLVGIAAALAVAAGAIGWIVFRALDEWTRPPRVAPGYNPVPAALACEDVSIAARDGVRLHGWFCDVPADGRYSHSAVVVCHGHGGDKSPHLNLVPWFRSEGLPVLLFDFRNHGSSEGTMTSLGCKERLDVLGAVDWLVARGRDRIGLLGYSMGAATAIATAPMSEHIRCVVSDSGFAQLLPVLERVALRRFRVEPLARLLAWLVWRATAWRVHCSMDAAEPLRAVRDFAGRPLLLIYGTADEYVETWQARALQSAAGGPVELWLVDGALHTEIDRMVPEEYRARVVGFFADHLTGSARDAAA